MKVVPPERENLRDTLTQWAVPLCRGVLFPQGYCAGRTSAPLALWSGAPATGRLHTAVWQLGMSRGLQESPSSMLESWELFCEDPVEQLWLQLDRQDCHDIVSCLGSLQESVARGSLPILVCSLHTCLPNGRDSERRDFSIYIPELVHPPLFLFFHYYMKKPAD